MHADQVCMQEEFIMLSTFQKNVELLFNVITEYSSANFSFFALNAVKRMNEANVNS